MRLDELNDEQKTMLKQKVLAERERNPSWGDVADADELVTDKELTEAYGNTEFVAEDFAA